ncbi:Uncharacterised protein [Mycobacteroides abscessus subsp. abscessus]|nr:Uncharacterised protein [Mycobacteroides abscessus subsp. abscessus]
MLYREIPPYRSVTSMLNVQYKHHESLQEKTAIAAMELLLWVPSNRNSAPTC